MPLQVDPRNPTAMDDYQKPPNAYIKQQPFAKGRYDPWDFEHPWSHGLCDCKKHCDETCYGILCYPCFTCQLAWRMNESCWITCCVPGYLAILRTKIRTIFRIEVLIKKKLIIYNHYIFVLLLGLVFY
jgi:hypothetical protein